MIPLKVKYALTISGTLAVIVFFGLWRFEVSENKRLVSEIDTLQDTVIDFENEVNQCNKDKTLIEGVSNGYQNDLVIVRRERDRLRNSPSCVLPKSSSETSFHSGSENQLPVRNGIRSDWLYNLAERADQDRITGKWCLEFVDQLYKSRGLNQ